MTCPAARLAAHRADALIPTTPRGVAREERSRGHGLTGGRAGDGVALPDEDQGEVTRRFGAMAAELGASTELGRALGYRAAMLTVRLERGYRNEAARLALAVDGAAKAYEDGRLAAVERLMETIDRDPATNARRLQQTAEGVALTIEAWQGLRVDLMHPDQKLWNAGHFERAENLLGRRTDDLPRSRIGALSRAMWFDFSGLGPGEGAGLNDQGRYEYARDRLAEIIDGRIEALGGFLGTFDEGVADRARAGAADRALFDDSRESILARKYEAATERSLFRTLRELRTVEAEAAAARVEPGAGAGVGVAVGDGHGGEAETPGPIPTPLGSFLPDGSPGRTPPAAVGPKPPRPRLEGGKARRARPGPG